jgi:hypothetical protein
METTIKIYEQELTIFIKPLCILSCAELRFSVVVECLHGNQYITGLRLMHAIGRFLTFRNEALFP